jgi:CHAD domain-containing protein
MKRALVGDRFAEVQRQWAALLDAPAGEGVPTIAEAAAERIRRVARRMVREGQAIGDGTPPEALHELRKRGKELRYLLELFGGLWPEEEVKPRVAQLKRLQDVLGRFQDREVQATFLRSLSGELAQAEGGTDAVLALGLVLDRLRADQHAARAEFHERFVAFAETAPRSIGTPS